MCHDKDPSSLKHRRCQAWAFNISNPVPTIATFSYGWITLKKDIQNFLCKENMSKLKHFTSVFFIWKYLEAYCPDENYHLPLTDCNSLRPELVLTNVSILQAVFLKKKKKKKNFKLTLPYC